MKFFLKPISVVFFALSCQVQVDSKGIVVDGKNPVAGGNGTSAGFSVHVRVPTTEKSKRMKTFGRPGLRSRKGMSEGGPVVIAASGAGGDAAYGSQRNPDKLQETTAYNISNCASGEIRISAWTFISFVLSCWYCCSASRSRRSTLPRLKSSF